MYKFIILFGIVYLILVIANGNSFKLISSLPSDLIKLTKVFLALIMLGIMSVIPGLSGIIKIIVQLLIALYIIKNGANIFNQMNNILRIGG